MKTHLHYFIIVFLLSAFNSAAFDQVNKSGTVANDVGVSISLNNRGTNVPVNKPVVLRVVLKNVSTNETFSIFQSVREETDEGYSFVVTTPLGTNKTILTGPTRGGATITIPPGMTREREFNLSRLYDFHEIGVYKVVAKYKNVWGSPYFEATSNPVEINVVKAEKSEIPGTNNPLSRWWP